VPLSPVEKRFQTTAGGGKTLWNSLRIDCSAGIFVRMIPEEKNEISPVLKVQTSLLFSKSYDFSIRKTLLK